MSPMDTELLTRAQVKEIIAERDGLRDALTGMGPALLVLRNMCRRAGLRLGTARAQELIDAVRKVTTDG